MSLMRSLRSSSGFSLVEALVASGIIVTALVGMSGVVTMVGGVNKKSRMENRGYDLEQHFLALAMGVDQYSKTAAWQTAFQAGTVPTDLVFQYTNLDSTAVGAPPPPAVPVPISAATMAGGVVTSATGGPAVTYFDQDLNVNPSCTGLSGTSCNYKLEAQMVNRADAVGLLVTNAATVFGIAYRISTSDRAGSSAVISNFMDFTGDPFTKPVNYNLFAPGGVSGTGQTYCNSGIGQFIMQGIDPVDRVPICIGVFDIGTLNTFNPGVGSTYDNSFPNGLTYSTAQGLQYTRTAPSLKFNCAAGTALAAIKPASAINGGVVSGVCRTLVADNATYSSVPGGGPTALGPADSLSGVACPVGYNSNSSVADCVVTQVAAKSRSGVCPNGTTPAPVMGTCQVVNSGRNISVFVQPGANTCGAYSYDQVTLNKLTCVSQTPGAPDAAAF